MEHTDSIERLYIVYILKHCPTTILIYSWVKYQTLDEKINKINYKIQGMTFYAFITFVHENFSLAIIGKKQYC